jgi:hypothetical protein
MDIADLWVVLTILGFFGVCFAFVRGCDRIIGPDDSVLEAPAENDDGDLIMRGAL